MTRMKLLKADNEEWYKDPAWRNGDIVDVSDEDVLLLETLGVAEKIVNTPEWPVKQEENV